MAQRIRTEYGGLDVLVNDIWGAEVLKGGPAEWNTPIWEHDLDKGLRILRLAIDTHLITSHHLLPLLITKRGGLLIEVTDGTTKFNATEYRISVFYDLAKVAVNRLAFSQGHELETARSNGDRHHAWMATVGDGSIASESPKPTGATLWTPGWSADTQTPPQVSLSRSHPAMSVGL